MPYLLYFQLFSLGLLVSTSPPLRLSVFKWVVWSIQSEMKEKFISEWQGSLIIREYWNPTFNLNTTWSVASFLSSLPGRDAGDEIPPQECVRREREQKSDGSLWRRSPRFWYVLIEKDRAKDVRKHAGVGFAGGHKSKPEKCHLFPNDTSYTDY